MPIYAAKFLVGDKWYIEKIWLDSPGRTEAALGNTWRSRIAAKLARYGEIDWSSLEWTETHEPARHTQEMGADAYAMAVADDCEKDDQMWFRKKAPAAMLVSETGTIRYITDDGVFHTMESAQRAYANGNEAQAQAKAMADRAKRWADGQPLRDRLAKRRDVKARPLQD
jgi:hypothetical protein